jgi:hypothetical protein
MAIAAKELSSILRRPNAVQLLVLRGEYELALQVAEADAEYDEIEAHS